MTSILIGILSASLLGSWHCAGMCGPFASFMGTTQRYPVIRQLGYHLGRLTTYLSLAILAFYFSFPIKNWMVS